MLCHLAFSQDGIYRSKTDFLNDEVYLIGNYLNHSSNSVIFSSSYSQLSYKAWEVWGFTDSTGTDFRTINNQFYRIENNGPIWVYTIEFEKGAESYMSYGLNGILKEVIGKNLEPFIQNNESLHNQFKALSKGEKNGQVYQFIAAYNKAYWQEQFSQK